MADGTDNPRFAIVAGTVSAFTMFMPSIHEVRHAPPDSKVAADCRWGYAFALGWSFIIGIVIASNQGQPAADLATWLAIAGILVLIYETFLNSTIEVDNGSDET